MSLLINEETLKVSRFPPWELGLWHRTRRSQPAEARSALASDPRAFTRVLILSTTTKNSWEDECPQSETADFQAQVNSFGSLTGSDLRVDRTLEDALPER